MNRLLFVLARAVFSAVCLLSSVYCLLAFVPFTYQQVIEFGLIGWTRQFAALHPWLWCLALLCAGWTLADDYRPGTRAHVVAFLGAGAASIVALILSPVLAGIQNAFSSLVWAGVWLAPLWWVALIDARGAGSRLPWDGSGDRDGARAFWACVAAGVATTALYAAFYVTRTYERPEVDALAPGDVMWSLWLHLLVFLGVFAALSLVRALAAGSRKPARLEFQGLVLAMALTTAAVIRWLVFPAISFLGTPGIVMALLYGGTLALVLAGTAVRRWNPDDPVETGLELALAPIAPPRRWPLPVRLLALPCWAGLTWWLADAAGVMDWNYLLQSLVAVLAWVLGFAWFHAVMPRTGPQRTGTAVVMLALPVVLLIGYRSIATSPAAWTGLGRGVGEREARLDRHAGFNVSFRLVHGLFRPVAAPPASGGADLSALFSTLQLNTNIPRTVKIDVPDLGLVPTIVPPAGRLPHIFVIVIDSLRQDYLAPYNPAVTFTPAVAAFARDPGTVVFRSAFSRYGATGLSEPAIWTGRMLPHQQYPTPFGQANSLQKLVQALGYAPYVSVDVPLRAVLAPWPGLTELDQGIANHDYDLVRTLDELTAKLRARQPSDQRPVFAYTQPQNIHISAITREGGRAIDAGDYAGFNGPYASRIRRLDAGFGAFIAALRDLGMYEDSLVILTSDHGDSLGEDGRFGHAYTIFPEILRIPMIVHLPAWLRDRPHDDRAIAVSTDLAPTIYDLLGQGPLANGVIEGRPLFSTQAAARAGRRDEGFVVASSYGPVYGWLAGDASRLYIADATAFREYAYDLTTGPAGRAEPVAAALRDTAAARIREALAQVTRTYRVPELR